jgi:hypothetical protein
MVIDAKLGWIRFLTKNLQFTQKMVNLAPKNQTSLDCRITILL